MRIYIIGYMYSGKSTIGKKLARALGFDFVDTDDLFEAKYHLSIPVFFEKYGEKLFREFEKEILLSTHNLQNTVISTGGGTPCFGENMAFIKKSGISVCLEPDIDTIMSRLHFSKKERPILSKMPKEELQSFILNQIETRNIFYKQADIIVPAKDVNVEKLRVKIEESRNSQSNL